MQISLPLPQFLSTKALLAVLGGRQGKLYLASDGVLEEVWSIDAKELPWSAREDAVHRGRRRIYGSRSVYKPKRNVHDERFARDTTSVITYMYREMIFDDLYLFAPEHLAPSILKAFSTDVRSSIRHIGHTNISQENPTRILERIGALETV